MGCCGGGICHSGSKGEYKRQKDFDLAPKPDKNPPLDAAVDRTVKFANDLIKEVTKKCCGATASCCGGGSSGSGNQSNTSTCDNGSCSKTTYNKTQGNPLSEEYVKEIVEYEKMKDQVNNDKTNCKNLCPEDEFALEHYLESEDMNVFTHHSVNMYKTYDRILMPIYKYYISNGRLVKKDGCLLAVVRGILTANTCEEFFGKKNNHTLGKSLDFKFIGIDSKEVYNDIVENKISLPDQAEVILLRDSLHIDYDESRTSLRLENFEKEEIV